MVIHWTLYAETLKTQCPVKKEIDPLKNYQEMDAKEWLKFDLTDIQKIEIGERLTELHKEIDIKSRELKQINDTLKVTWTLTLG